MAYELAKMQELLHRFCLTLQSLQTMLTDLTEATQTIVAEQEGKVVAFAMYTLLKNNRLYHDGYAMYIDELYVLPENRNQGIGKGMFQYIGSIALKHNCNRLEWWVEQNNQEAFAFYEHIGARALTEFMTFRLQKPALETFVTHI
ncbi:GNAT family N-acetyltransferase [Candidatus Berkiella aquae]|nr:GNAT family N-acetyltransferase [Candidatus Berkiella aquae]MCS5711265.1 GNAT family N-acetyltransferase [Candidatus Berkiella aquae]